MTAAELLRTLVLRLEEAGLAYAIAGSVASMVYGEPRATLDIDVVVRLDAADGERLLGLFPREEFYVDAGRVRTVIRKGGSFNVIHPASGLKIDFYAVSDEIEERQIDRRIRRPVLPDREAWLSPPEELILKKLQYFRAGGSEKHLRDVRSMLAISPEQIDEPLLEQLVTRFGLNDVWRRVKRDR